VKAINLTYAIINTSDIDAVEFTQVGENNPDTVRKSLDDSMFVLKWNVEPTFIKDGTITPLKTLTYTECYNLMQTPDWAEPEESE